MGAASDAGEIMTSQPPDRAADARAAGPWPGPDWVESQELWPAPDPDQAWPAPDLWGPQDEHTTHEEWPRSPAGGAGDIAAGGQPAAGDYPSGIQPAVDGYPSGPWPAAPGAPAPGRAGGAGGWPAAPGWPPTGQPGSPWPGPPQWPASAAPAGAAASAADWPEDGGWPAGGDRPPGEHWAEPPAWQAGVAQAGTAPAGTAQVEAVDIPGYPAQPGAGHPWPGGTWGSGDFWPGNVPAPGPGQAIPAQAIPAQATPGQAAPGRNGPPEAAEAVQAAEPAARPAARPAGADPRWVMAGYLTVPFFSFLVPLAVYFGSRGSPRARAHAAQAANTAFTVLMYEISAAIMGAMLALDSPVVALALAGPLITALWLVSLVHLVRAASAAGRGSDFRMPPWLCTTLVRPVRGGESGRP